MQTQIISDITENAMVITYNISMRPYLGNPTKIKNRDSSRLWGISLNSLRGDDLHFVPEDIADKPDLTIDLREKLAPYEDEIEERHGWREGTDIFDDLDRLKQVSRNLPLDPFWSECSFDEITKIVFSDAVQSELGDLFFRERYERTNRDHPEEREMPEPYEFIYKLKNSLWHYGKYPSSWNTLVTGYYAIPDFDFGPNFEVRFDHSPYFNYWGGAFHVRRQMREMKMSWKKLDQYWHDNELYIDGVFAYLIYYKGRHVLTIGFSLGEDRIYLSQIQVRNQLGNRWLYKIPGGYFDYAVNRMADHFGSFGLDTYLVDGKSLADRVDSLYPKDQSLDPEIYERMVLSYSQPLDNYRRGELKHKKHMDYYKLLPYTDIFRLR